MSSNLWILAGLGFALTVVLQWRVLVMEERNHSMAQLDVRLEGVRNQLQSASERQPAPLEMMALQWEMHEKAGQIKWEDDARHLIQKFPGLRAVGFVTPDLRAKWVVPANKHATVMGGDMGLDDNRLRMFTEARNRNAAVFGSSLRLLDGSTGYLICQPLGANGSHAGYLVGAYSHREVLEETLRNVALEHGVAVYGGNGPLYSRGSAPASSKSVVREDFFPFGNELWLIRVWPPTELSAKAALHGPHAFLATGLVLATMLAASLRLSGLAHRRRIDAETANVRLRQEGAERQRAEFEKDRLNSELIRHNARFENILSTVPGIVWEARGWPDSEEQQLTYVSRHVETMLGYSVEEWLGTPNFWLSVVHPEDREKAMRRAAEIYSSGRGGRNEFRWIAKDGRVVWVEAEAVVLRDEEGRPVGMTGVNLDTTERRKAEESLQYRLRLEELVAAVSARFINLSGEKITHGVQGSLAEIGQFANADRSYIFRFTEDDRYLSNTHEWCAAGVQPCIGELQNLPSANFPWMIGKLSLLEDVFVSSVADMPPEAESEKQTLQSQGIQSLLLVPMAAGGRLIGFLGLDFVNSRRRNMNDDALLLKVVAEIFVNALARQQAERDLLEKEQALQNLSAQLVKAQEAERRHLARELHDVIGQALTAIEINLRTARGAPGSRETNGQLDEAIALTEEVSDQVRQMSLSLRPSMLDDLGLEAALRWYAKQQALRCGFALNLSISPLESRLDPTVETACFRVAQEALTNIARHARPKTVTVALTEDPGGVLLCISDDGIGFNIHKMRQQATQGVSLGLLSMEERARLAGGRVHYQSDVDSGTQVRVWFPKRMAPAKYLPHRAATSQA